MGHNNHGISIEYKITDIFIAVIKVFSASQAWPTDLEAERRARDQEKHPESRPGDDAEIPEINSKMRRHYVPYTTSADLPTNEQGGLAEHLVVLLGGDDAEMGARCGPFSDAMADMWDPASGSTSERRLVHATGALARELGLASTGGCGQAVCLERGTPLDFVGHWKVDFAPRDVADPAGTGRQFVDWVVPSCQKAEIGFVSYHSNPLEVYWIEPGAVQYPPRSPPSACQEGTCCCVRPPHRRPLLLW